MTLQWAQHDSQDAPGSMTQAHADRMQAPATVSKLEGLAIRRISQRESALADPADLPFANRFALDIQGPRLRWLRPSRCRRLRRQPAWSDETVRRVALVSPARRHPTCVAAAMMAEQVDQWETAD
jgi:hypothetical protein